MPASRSSIEEMKSRYRWAGSGEDLAKRVEAVDRLLQRGELVGPGAVALFYLPVVFEEGNVVDGGLDSEDQAELVVHLD